MTRNDAALITDASSGGKSSNSSDVASSTGLLSFAKGDDFPPGSFVKGFFCEDIAGSCSEYYTNTAKYYWIKGVVEGYTVISRVEFRVGLWVMLIVMLYLLAKTLQKLSLSRSTNTNEDQSQNSFLPLRLCVSVANPILIVSILFTFTNCGIFGGGKKKGDAPWLLLASGINSNTASVDDASNGSVSGASGSGGSGGSALVPVVGMYFLHPDHLGSITMITDGRGNVIAGGNNGGKSHISYKPYGEIHRTDSSGPDITRFKYTGQEEDKESGLMYYKARYYDPMIGRFLQADSVFMPESTFGMNRYMYVSGSPTNYRDPSGHADVAHMFGQMVKHTTTGAAQIAKDMKGGAEWASGGLARAKDTYDKAVFQATASKYQRGPWAKAQKNIFGEKQGSMNNKYWDDLITKHKIDPRTAIEAWGGSFAMIWGVQTGFSMGRAYLASASVKSFMYQYAGLNQWLNWTRLGYVYGGTHGFTRGMSKWDERGARHHAHRAFCASVLVSMVVVTWPEALGGPEVLPAIPKPPMVLPPETLGPLLEEHLVRESARFAWALTTVSVSFAGIGNELFGVDNCTSSGSD